MTFVRSNVGLNDLDPYEITVTSTDQILNGYKDYDSNGDLITGTNLGYDAGVIQGHTDRDTGVTVANASQVISGYKARTFNGTLVEGTDAGYSAGVTQGHTDRDSGVTVTNPNHIINGYKARNGSGTLLTGTDKGYTAGLNQGHMDMSAGVTITDASHIVSGYKGRTSGGTLVTGTAPVATKTASATLEYIPYRRTTTLTVSGVTTILGITSINLFDPWRQIGSQANYTFSGNVITIENVSPRFDDRTTEGYIKFNVIGY